MYEIVNEPNVTIAFDMDTELSPFGVFGVISVLGTLTLVTGLVFIPDTKN